MCSYGHKNHMDKAVCKTRISLTQGWSLFGSLTCCLVEILIGLQERWAEPGADLASSRPAAKLDTRASDATLPGAQQPKRFLPFSTGPRQ